MRRLRALFHRELSIKDEMPERYACRATRGRRPILTLIQSPVWSSVVRLAIAVASGASVGNRSPKRSLAFRVESVDPPGIDSERDAIANRGLQVRGDIGHDCFSINERVNEGVRAHR
jgi:hypothetical protein